MKFSIIVPVYNVEKFIRKCLDSILMQNYSDYEVILVDDGSVDSSGAICDEYGSRYKNVKVIHQNNQGLSGARNTGLEAALGEWIVFVDSDDWVELEMLETLSLHIDKSDADMYSFNARKVDENGRIMDRLIFAAENDIITFQSEKDKYTFYYDSFMQYKIGWEVCFRIYRRNIISTNKIKFRPTHEVFAEDYLFTFQYLLYTRKISFLCNIFYNYLQRNISLIHSVDKSTVLPRLYNWAVAANESVRKAHLSYFIKNFDGLYFMLINHHIRFLLSDVPQNEISADLKNLSDNRFHRNWIKKIQKNKNNRQLWKYMGGVEWL